MSIEQMKVERIPWIPLVILTVVLGLLTPMSALMVPRAASFWYNIGLSTCTEYLMPMSYALLFFLVFLPRIGKKLKFSPSTLTYVYACVVSVAYTSYTDEVFIPPTWWANRYGPSSSISMQLQPWFFAPRPEIAKQLLAGGVPIPWGEWLPSILWWWLVYSLWAFFFVGLASILRRQWVETEKLPYPLVTVANEIVRVAGREKADEKSRTVKWLLLGVLLGLAFFAVLFMILVFPWFPDVFGWRVNMCGFGAAWIPSSSPLASILALGKIEKMPLYVAGLYLVPLSILFNAWFWWMVMAALVQIAYAMGYYTSLPTMNGCGKEWCGDQSVTMAQPFIWGVFANLGVIIGIFISYWIMNRGYVADTIRAALRKGRLLEAEKNEAVSYRTAYAMLLGAAVMLVVAFMFAGLGPATALIVVFVTFLFQFMQVYFLNLLGFLVPAGFETANAFLKPIWPYGPVPPTMEWTVAQDFTVQPGANSPGGGWGFPFLAMTSGFAMAGFTGTKPGNVLKVVLFAAVLTPLLAQISILWGDYTFGSTKLPGYGSFGSGPIDRLTSGWYDSNPMSTGGPFMWWPQALAGAIAAFVLYYLHSRFIWFPFEPIGFLMGISWTNILYELWQPALMAWVIKTVTLRIGGSKMYDSLGRPIAAGFIIGYALMAVIGATIGVVRFFIPF